MLFKLDYTKQIARQRTLFALSKKKKKTPNNNSKTSIQPFVCLIFENADSQPSFKFYQIF